MNTNWSYVELTEVTDEVTSVNETLIGVDAETYATEANNALIDNNTAETYPDLVFKYEVEAVEVNGVPATVHGLVAGHHPIARPR